VAVVVGVVVGGAEGVGERLLTAPKARRLAAGVLDRGPRMDALKVAVSAVQHHTRTELQHLRQRTLPLAVVSMVGVSPGRGPCQGGHPRQVVSQAPLSSSLVKAMAGAGEGAEEASPGTAMLSMAMRSTPMRTMRQPQSAWRLNTRTHTLSKWWRCSTSPRLALLTCLSPP
jgi:hypothetical protein